MDEMRIYHTGMAEGPLVQTESQIRNEDTILEKRDKEGGYRNRYFCAGTWCAKTGAPALDPWLGQNIASVGACRMTVRHRSTPEW